MSASASRMSKSHRHLLKHPVITSFLWCKWTRIRRFFNRNLRFYLLFVYVLTWYIFDEFDESIGWRSRKCASGTRKSNEKTSKWSKPPKRGVSPIHSRAGTTANRWCVALWLSQLKQKSKLKSTIKQKTMPLSSDFRPFE